MSVTFRNTDDFKNPIPFRKNELGTQSTDIDNFFRPTREPEKESAASFYDSDAQKEYAAFLKEQEKYIYQANFTKNQPEETTNQSEPTYSPEYQQIKSLIAEGSPLISNVLYQNSIDPSSEIHRVIFTNPISIGGYLCSEISFSNGAISSITLGESYNLNNIITLPKGTNISFHANTSQPRLEISYISLWGEEKLNIPGLQGGIITRIYPKPDGVLECVTDQQSSMFRENDTVIERYSNSPVIIYPDGSVGFYQKENGSYCEISAEGEISEINDQMSSRPHEGTSRILETITVSNRDDISAKINAELEVDGVRVQLSELGQRYGFTITTTNDRDPWVEDSSILLNNTENAVYIPGTFNGNDASISQSRGTRIGQENAAGQGRVASRGINLDDIAYNQRIYGQSYLEGGNVLACRSANGEAMLVIGEESIDYTMISMGLDLESRIRTRSIELGLNYDEVLSEEEIAPLREQVARDREIARTQIAIESGIPLENITFIPQFDFHIDMWYRPLSDGVFGVPDFESAVKMIDDLLNNNTTLSTQQRNDLSILRDGLVRMNENTGIQEYMTEAEARLTSSGYTIQKIPCFSILDGLGEENNGKYPLINYMNGIAATAGSVEEGAAPDLAGKPYFITNSSGITQLDESIRNYFIANNIFNSVEFVSHNLLVDNGGLDCVTLERDRQ